MGAVPALQASAATHHDAAGRSLGAASVVHGAAAGAAQSALILRERHTYGSYVRCRTERGRTPGNTASCMGSAHKSGRQLRAPGLFVPTSLPVRGERFYESLAAWCKCPVPAVGRRIYSMVFGAEGDEWTATVGQPLRVVGRSRRWTGEVRGLREVWISDPARVLGILGDSEFFVVTDHLISGVSVGSRFPNPLVVSEPRVLVYFATDNAVSQEALSVAPSQGQSGG